MNRISGKRRVRRVVGLAAAVALAATLAGTMVASAQSRSERGPWERLDLTKEQREKVRDIVKEHRDESRDALHKKLATVLTDEQLAQLDTMGRRRGGDEGMWDNRPGRPGHRGRRQMLTPGKRNQCGGCDYRGRGGQAMGRGGRGMGHGDMRGSGPRTGEFREERGERMIERLTVVLDLTDTQKEKVAAIVKEHQAQFKDFDRSKLSVEERDQTRDAHRLLLSNRVKEVLTDAQKEQYDEFMKTMPGPRRGARGKRY